MMYYYPINYQPQYYAYQPYGQMQYPYDQLQQPNDFRQQQDSGGKPFVINIERATEQNRAFRSTIWTGRHLQLVLMSLRPGEDIGLEVHPHVDQFFRIEEGNGLIQMGDSPNRLNFERRVGEDSAIVVPAGKWHNLINTGNRPLKLYTIYAPPEHPFGTYQQTKAQATSHNHLHR